MFLLFLQLDPGQQLPSPQELMGKILIKNKKKHQHRASNGGSIRRKEGTDEQSSPLNGVYTRNTPKPNLIHSNTKVTLIWNGCQYIKTITTII